MSTVSQVTSAVAQSNEETRTQKTKVYGKTIGEPELSEKAAEYYEKLKKKYGNMDFILVSKDMKQQAQAQAGSYANASKMVVLIDEEKIERMAEDEDYRKQYEGIIRNAATQLPQMKSGLQSTGANVKGFGIKVNDNGTASLFAVIDKSLELQKERIAKKAEENRDARKADAKKAWEERWEKTDEPYGTENEDTVTVTASTIEELVQKVKDVVYEGMSDNVQTDWERTIGQHIDYQM